MTRNLLVGIIFTILGISIPLQFSIEDRISERRADAEKMQATLEFDIREIQEESEEITRLAEQSQAIQNRQPFTEADRVELQRILDQMNDLLDVGKDRLRQNELMRIDAEAAIRETDSDIRVLYGLMVADVLAMVIIAFLAVGEWRRRRRPDSDHVAEENDD